MHSKFIGAILIMKKNILKRAPRMYTFYICVSLAVPFSAAVNIPRDLEGYPGKLQRFLTKRRYKRAGTVIAAMDKVKGR